MNRLLFAYLYIVLLIGNAPAFAQNTPTESFDSNASAFDRAVSAIENAHNTLVGLGGDRKHLRILPEWQTQNQDGIHWTGQIVLCRHGR